MLLCRSRCCSGVRERWLWKPAINHHKSIYCIPDAYSSAWTYLKLARSYRTWDDLQSNEKEKTQDRVHRSVRTHYKLKRCVKSGTVKNYTSVPTSFWLARPSLHLLASRDSRNNSNLQEEPAMAPSRAQMKASYIVEKAGRKLERRSDRNFTSERRMEGKWCSRLALAHILYVCGNLDWVPASTFCTDLPTNDTSCSFLWSRTIG